MSKRFSFILVAMVFFVMLIIGLTNYSNYGISTDEEACHYRAIVNYKYLAERVGLKIVPDDPEDLSSRSATNQPVYVFNNYKRVETPDLLDHDPKYEVYYQKTVGNEIILSVYKHKWGNSYKPAIIISNYQLLSPFLWKSGIVYENNKFAP